MKKLILLLIFALMLTCACVVPSGFLDATPKPAGPTMMPLGLGLTKVRLHPGGGSLLKQLRAQVPKAAALGQHMFVEFDASW